MKSKHTSQPERREIDTPLIKTRISYSGFDEQIKTHKQHFLFPSSVDFSQLSQNAAEFFEKAIVIILLVISDRWRFKHVHHFMCAHRGG